MKVDAKKLMLLMANKAMSVDKLADLTGLNKTTLTLAKSGKRAVRTETLGKIAKALECKVEDFIAD